MKLDPISFEPTRTLAQVVSTESRGAGAYA